MKDYVSNESMCAMELTRAFNPRGLDVYHTIQPQFQYETLDYMHKSRGHFLGIQNLIKEGIFTNENIGNYIKDLAILMARLHYKIKNDGYDIELFISKIKGGNSIIYVADFDLSEFYEDYPDAEKISRMSWCFGAVPYFPIEGILYKIFSTNYIDEAKKYNMEDIALKVLVDYTN